MVGAPPVQAQAPSVANAIIPPVANAIIPPSESSTESYPLRAWVWDALAFAYLLSGGVRFDPRIALGSFLSLNQVLGLLIVLRCAWDLRTLRRMGVPAPTTLVTVLTLTLLLALRCVGTPNLPYGQFKVLSYGLLVLPVLMHVHLHVRSRAAEERFLWIPVLAMSALLVLGLPHVVSIHEGERLGLLGGGPNVLARHLGTGILCLFVLLQLCGRRDRVLVGLATGLPLAALALLLTGTKTVLLALPLAFAFLFWKVGRRSICTAILFGLVVLALLPLVTHSFVAQLPKDGGLVRLLRLPDVDDPLGSYGARMIYLRGTWDELLRHPWLGVGTGGWGMRLGLGLDEAYPHNIFLELLSELGILGLALALVPLLTFPRAKSAGRRPDPLALGLAGLALFWALNVQLSGDVVDSRFLWLWLGLLESHTRRSSVHAPPKSLDGAEVCASAAWAEPVLNTGSRSVGITRE